jgi:tetratricopeptide (TPR) repeat protein
MRRPVPPRVRRGYLPELPPETSARPLSRIEQLEQELAERPYSRVTLMELSKAYREEGQIQQAADVLAKRTTIKRYRGGHRWEEMDFGEVQKAFASAVKAESHAEAADVLSGFCRNPRGEPNEINRLLDEAHAEAPVAIVRIIEALQPSQEELDLGVLTALGFAFKRANKVEEAKKTLRAAVDLHAKSVPARHALYEVAWKEHPFLVAQMRKVSEAEPDNLDYKKALAATYMRYRLPEMAVRTLMPLYKNGMADARTHELLVLGLLQTGAFATIDKLVRDARLVLPDDLKMVQGYLSGDDDVANGFARRIIQKTFDPMATAVYVITGDLAARWRHSRPGDNPLPGLSVEQMEAVRERINGLENQRSHVAEDLVQQAWIEARRVPMPLAAPPPALDPEEKPEPAGNHPRLVQGRRATL